jgi:hypothetical protein
VGIGSVQLPTLKMLARDPSLAPCCARFWNHRPACAFDLGWSFSRARWETSKVFPSARLDAKQALREHRLAQEASQQSRTTES